MAAKEGHLAGVIRCKTVAGCRHIVYNETSLMLHVETLCDGHFHLSYGHCRVFNTEFGRVQNEIFFNL